ncbi:MAG: bacteriocin system transporter, ATP-binding protein [Chloroflexi bacterium]|jgi:NHLM bacteriocin system ABC transporter ATP-binding protein|nr:bacteriocin system transporter, ATP-binding protein [Chloroflexota bacterium]
MATTTIPGGGSTPSTVLQPHLHILNGRSRQAHVPLDFGRLQARPLVLGRHHQEADVVLSSPGNQVSRRHAFISYRLDDELAILSDAGSANGTRLNGQFIAGPTPLLPGDIIACGDVELIFVVPFVTSVPLFRPPGLPRRQYPEDLEPGMARLEVIASHTPSMRPGSFCRLTHRHPFLIGRQSGNDFRLLEEGEAARQISRKQAEIRWDGTGYLLRDPGASNPTWLNGKALVAPSLLKEGDQFQIGSTVLRFRAPRTPLAGEPGKFRPVVTGPAPVLRFAARWALHLGPRCVQLPLDRPVAIGRSKDTDFRLQDPSVSRQHALLRFDAATRRFIISDRGSANGTLVNGIAASENHPLAPGDRLTLGEFEFIFDELTQAAVAAEVVVPLTQPVTLQLEIAPDGNLVPAGSPDKLPAGSTLSGSPPLVASRAVQPLARPGPGELDDRDIDPSEIVDKSLTELMVTRGISLMVGGNQPFLLDDPASVWLVRSGRVETFAVQVKAGQPAAARHHVCSFGPGQVLFGLDSNRYGEGLGMLAVALVNTELVKVPLSRLRHLSRHVAFKTEITGLIAQWLEALSKDITKETISNRTEVLLDPNAEVALETQQTASPRKDGVWLKPVEGECLFLGEEDMASPYDDALFPLYGFTWLQALSGSRLVTYGALEALDQPGFWNGLDLFYELFFRVKFTNIRLATYDEINRLRKRAEFDLAAGRNALQELVSILEPDSAVPGLAGPDQADLLLEACKLVGTYQGIMVQRSAAVSEEQDTRRNPLEDIANNSRMRTREITLTPRWWRTDAGPILASVESGSERYPVALLPTSPKSYEMVNPADGTRQPVTPALAATLSSKAFVFYRSFPDKAIKVRDLVKFGFRGTRKDLIVTLLLGMAGGLLNLAIPIMTGFAFDTVIPSANSSYLIQVLAGLVVVAISLASFQVIRGVAILRLESKLDISIQAGLWNRLLSLPTTFFRQYSVGDLANRANGIDQIRTLISGTVITTILGTIFSSFSLILLFTYDAGLAGVAVGLVVLILAIIIGIELWQLRYQRRLAEYQGKISGLVLQLLTGIAKLRVAGAEIRAFAVWAREFAAQRKLAFKARTIGNLLTVFNAILPILVYMVIFWALDVFKNRTLSIGAFLAFIAAFGQFLGAMISMASSFTTIFQAVPIFERAKPILETLPEVNLNKSDPGELSGAIEVNHISFRYAPDSPLVLDDVSLKIEPGKFVAIVGPSGAGKSSIFRLLLGFEKPEAGSIYYDNQDISGLDIQAVRRQMGVVIQSGKLMPGDIFNNIVGNAPFTIEDAWEAARLAGMEKDLKEMPMGMYTLISEGGSTLSGGQKQRLMIARAIISRPRILLFDEATSALDNHTQAIVSRSLESLQATRVVIAHRLSTIINADRIYVLQGGKVAQSGTYQELIGQEGPFKQLALRQLG